jgi:hypothetical protein
MRLGHVLQLVADHAGLDARPLVLGVDLEDPVHVLRKVEDDGDVRALPDEARTAAARQHRGTVAATRFQRRDDIVDGAREDDADRHLAVDGEVVRVQRAAAGVEPDLAFYLPRELLPERAGVGDRKRRRVETERGPLGLRLRHPPLLPAPGR